MRIRFVSKRKLLRLDWFNIESQECERDSTRSDSRRETLGGGPWRVAVGASLIGNGYFET